MIEVFQGFNNFEATGLELLPPYEVYLAQSIDFFWQQSITSHNINSKDQIDN